MYLIPFNEYQIEVIKKEDFYQTPEKVEEDVTQLIDWLSKQPHLPNITDREWLTNFIVSCKYNLQRSKKIIENYFIAKAKYPEFFGRITTEEINYLRNFVNVYLLPKPMSDGKRILYSCTIKPMSDNMDYNAIYYIKLSLSILDLQLKKEPMHGNIIIYDIKYLQLSHFLKYTPTISKNFLNCLFESFPMRVKCIHVINPPKFINRMMTFFKIFLSNKIKDRILIHDNLDDLYEHIPKDILPDICGGTYGSIVQLDKDMMDFIMSNQEWLERRKKADLSKLPENKKIDEMEGTFKKLQFD